MVLTRGMLILLLLLLLGPLFAQEQKQRLSGRVVDKDGAGLPGVTITVGCRCEDCDDPEACTCCPDERTYRVQVTNADGGFRFQLEPGRYSITAELEGFSTVQYRGVEVRTGGTTVEITMASAEDIEIE